MTIITRITISGFKSFANKTDIDFSTTYNCILGPNGSGKSNIGDAICFVLGRLGAKSMRVEKAANLVFNGGKNKKAGTVGRVEIAFSNDPKEFPIEAAEVVISREIHTNGNSVYRINDKKVTRTEIVDLLGYARINPDGYNIILQGDITRFVEMSSIERRKIIEEISDISIYEDKKHKAMLELEKTEQKLNDAEIILKERKTYLKELQKDRDQALKYKELKVQVDSYRATILKVQIDEKEAGAAEYSEQHQKAEGLLKNAESEVEVLRAKVQECRNSVIAINSEIELKGEKEQVAVHKEIEDLKVTIAKEKSRHATLKEELGKISMRRNQFKAELDEIEDKFERSRAKGKQTEDAIMSRKQDLIEVEAKIAEFKKKNKIESSVEMEKEIETLDATIESKQEEIGLIRQNQQQMLREKDKLEFQVQSVDERILKVKEVEEGHKDQLKILAQHKADFKSATLRLNTCLDQDSSFASQLSNARKKLVDMQEKHATLQAKAFSIRAGAAANSAVAAVLEQKKRFPGVFGTISELGQVNKKYALALEMAAGQKLQNIVVDSDKTAAECIEYLKSAKLGAASFIPLNKIKATDISDEDRRVVKGAGSGVHDFALSLVTYRPEHARAFAHVFGNTLVVDSIEVARRIGIGKIRMVTLEGDLAEGSGVMRGGFNAARGSSGFKEKDSLEELERLEGDIGECQSVISNVEVKRQANEQEISFLRNKKGELEGEIIKLEKSLHLETGDLDASGALKKELKSQLAALESQTEEVSMKVSAINRELADLKMRKQNLRNQVTELRNPRLLAQLTAFEESRQQIRDDLVRLESELKNAVGSVDSMLNSERDKIREILKQQDKEESQFNSEVAQLASVVVEKEKLLLIKEKESKEFYAKYKELFAQREKLNAEIVASEGHIEQIREKARGFERELNLLSLKNAEVRARLAGLREEFERYKEAPLLEGFEKKDISRLQEEMSKIEVHLGQMTAVNMKALEIYEQVEKEYNELIEKKDSLGREKTDVLTLMNEIETKKKEHFMKTYTQANTNFIRIFKNLFRKGEAYLELDNPDDVFSDGLSIKVKITGTRFMDLKSLSGGEKTLTALSFIFAIQEYQPASFYILDEIDAALDKHNAELLSKLIREYCNRAQYIVISHNDAIISEADTLFGVSMTDGISKVTSLKI